MEQAGSLDHKRTGGAGFVDLQGTFEIFSDEWLAEHLAFRGGTALHKLYLTPQHRYSEDIDLVQVSAQPFGPVIDRIRERLTFLGEPQRKQKANNNTLYYRFDSEFPPIQRRRLKVS